MTVAILPDLATQILIPTCAVVGILFALFQYTVVAKVKVSVGKSESGGNNGAAESLIEEDEGIDGHNVVTRCAEIHNTISEDLMAPDLDSLKWLKKFECLPVLSSSTKSWLDSIRKPGNKRDDMGPGNGNPNFGGARVQDDGGSGGVTIGPQRPPPGWTADEKEGSSSMEPKSGAATSAVNSSTPGSEI